MYAVVKTGGKQYRIAPGDKLRVETLAAEPGETIYLSEVMMIADGDQISIGTPMLEAACVSATVLGHGRGKKISIVKFRRRKHYRRQAGHRQNYTELSIGEVFPLGLASADDNVEGVQEPMAELQAEAVQDVSSRADVAESGAQDSGSADTRSVEASQQDSSAQDAQDVDAHNTSSQSADAQNSTKTTSGE